MMMWREGTVLEERRRWGQAIEYRVAITSHDRNETECGDDGAPVHHCGSTDVMARALAYVPHVGEPRVGDRVLLSASAVERALGTGGYMLIVAVPDRLPADPPAQAGHIMKARYTPSQWMVQGVDEQESPWHKQLEHADSLDGMLVIAADLHSAVPAIAHVIHRLRPHTRVAYVMNDGGALPAWFSMAGVDMREKGLILGTITCGQAYGGELEAVNVYTGLLAARHVWNADIAIVAQGPGNLGTGTKWGFSGVNVGEALNAAHILGGKPVAALRLSNADRRGRHYGISHHSMRVLLDVVSSAVTVPLPLFSSADNLSSKLESSFLAEFAYGVAQLRARDLLTLANVPTAGTLALGNESVGYTASELLRSCPVTLRTMGRDLDGDPASFLGAAVAGIYSAEELTRR